MAGQGGPREQQQGSWKLDPERKVTGSSRLGRPQQGEPGAEAGAQIRGEVGGCVDLRAQECGGQRCRLLLTSRQQQRDLSLHASVSLRSSLSLQSVPLLLGSDLCPTDKSC